MLSRYNGNVTSKDTLVQGVLYVSEDVDNKINLSKYIGRLRILVLQKILRISLTEGKSKVIKNIGTKPEITLDIKRRKLKSFSHAITGKIYALLELIKQCQVRGKRNVRRRKLSWLRNMRK